MGGSLRLRNACALDAANRPGHIFLQTRRRIAVRVYRHRRSWIRNPVRISGEFTARVAPRQAQLSRIDCLSATRHAQADTDITLVHTFGPARRELESSRASPLLNNL